MTAIPPKVLVIEDDPPIRRFLRTALEAEGMVVHDAETGQRGLIAAAARRPDLVILDLGLPDMDGLEVIGFVPICAGHTSPATRTAAGKSGSATLGLISSSAR